MQNIRRATKKHRTLLLIVIILLLVGVVGSFAVWDSNSYKNETAGNDTSEWTNRQFADYYAQYIGTVEPESVDAATYDEAIQLANLYNALYQYSYLAVTNELTEDVEKETYSTQATESLNKCLLYYNQAIATVPDGTADASVASLHAQVALLQLQSGDEEAALASYATAKELAPYSSNVVSAYAQYIYYYQQDGGGYEAVKTYLNDALSHLEEGTEDYVTINGLITQYDQQEEYFQKLLQSIEDAQKSSETTTENNGETTTDTTTDTEN